MCAHYLVLHPPLLQLLVNPINLLCQELVLLLLTGGCLKHGLLNLHHHGILGISMATHGHATWRGPVLGRWLQH